MLSARYSQEKTTQNRSEQRTSTERERERERKRHNGQQIRSISCTCIAKQIVVFQIKFKLEGSVGSGTTCAQLNRTPLFPLGRSSSRMSFDGATRTQQQSYCSYMKNYIDYHNVSHKIFHNKLTFAVSGRQRSCPQLGCQCGLCAMGGVWGVVCGGGVRFRYSAKWRT